ncbi:MAG: hypothetical protein WEB60_12895 [Terrimicrobiaceae bacterium]
MKSLLFLTRSIPAGQTLGALCGLLLCLPLHAAAPDLAAQLEMARADGQLSSQIEIIRRILQTDRGNGELRGELINLWFAEGDYNMAEKTLNEWKTAPAEKVALTTAKILVERDKKPDAGLMLLEAFLLSEPKSLPATEAFAELLWRENKSERLAGFLQSSRLTSYHPGLLIRRAQAKRDLGKFESALADATLAGDLDAKNDLVVATLASFDRLAVAAPHLSAADGTLQKSPQDLGALMSRAYWRQYASLPQQLAHQDAKVALQAFPDSAVAKIAFAKTSGLPASETLKQHSVNVEVPDLNDAQGTTLVGLDVAVADPKNRVTSLTKRAAFLNAVALQYLLALADAEAALREDPKSPPALLEQMTALLRLGRTNQAASVLHSLESLKPAKEILSAALLAFADAEFAQGEMMLALGTVNRSLQLHRTPAALKLRGAIHQRLGMTGESKADLELAATLEKSSKR